MNVPQTIQAPLLELDLLKTLVAIAETGNFSAAAEVVHRTPSAVSMQVKRIEELLGRPVFVRDSRSVSLTVDGEILLTHARRVLALNREMISRFIMPEVSGEVRLGSVDDVAERFLPNTLRRFADSHPCVTVNVVVENSDRLISRVQNRQLDLAILTCDQDRPGAEGMEILMEEQLVWAALKGGVAAEQNPLPVSVWETGCSWRKAGLEGLEREGRDYRIAFQSAYTSGQRAALLADLAVAPLPISSLSDDIVEADPACKLPPLPTYTFGLLLREEPSASVLAAADHIRASFAQR